MTRQHVALLLADGRRLTLGRDNATISGPTEYVPSGGLERLNELISRLLSFQGAFAALSIFTPDGQRGFGIWARGGRLSAFFTVRPDDQPSREPLLRNLFVGAGIEPTHDFLAPNGPADEHVRYLLYEIGTSAQSAAALAKAVLTKIFDIGRDDALEFALTGN